MTTRPPSRTLLPYTTLFRSRIKTVEPLPRVTAEERRRKIEEAGFNPFRLRDRKSTRLNSSHGYISYAVFCLTTTNSRVAGQAIAREWPVATWARCRAARHAF